MSKLTKNQKNAIAKVEAGKAYKLSEAAALLKEITFTKFDASVDVDVRLGVDPRKANQMVRGVVTLPHGTGKVVRIDTVPVGRRQRVRQILLIANTVAAVLGLPVNGVSGDAEHLGILGYKRDIVPAGPVACGHGRRHGVRTGVAGVDAVVFKQKHLIHDDGLVSMFLGAERATDILGAGHDLAALVVQTQDARHHIRAALRSLQRRRQFLAVADASSFRSLTCGESRSQHAGVSLSGLPTSGGEAGMLLMGEEALTVPLGDTHLPR